MKTADDRVVLGSQPTRSIEFARRKDGSMDDDNSDVELKNVLLRCNDEDD